MPPRISSHRLSAPSSTQCFRTRPLLHPHSRTLFSPSQPTRSPRTRLRQDMFAWLKGPGKVFRDPLPNSTNYLNAYNRQGELLRQKDRRREQHDPELDEAEETIQAREREAGHSAEEMSRRAALRDRKRNERMELEERGGIPRERPSDLRPYPLNPQFQSQAVLSEDLREQIYELIAKMGMDLKSVSAIFGVDIRRVAAVVRLKTMEKEWAEKGKPLAKPYSKAVLAMLPQTRYRPNVANPPPHEPINDLPVHPWTRQQIFVPASESRAFTRADAAKAFHPNLLPADERIAHPELVQIHKWDLEGHDRDARRKLMQAKDEEAARVKQEKDRKEAEWKARTQVVVPGRRWDFKFQDISADDVGKDGRGRRGVGLRYGMPHEDRKKGQVKIPTKVE